MKPLFTQSYFSHVSTSCFVALFSLALGANSLAPSEAAAQEEEIRVISGLGSSELLIGDLEHIVSKVAGRDDSFQDNIFPNIDIFLYGVDPAKGVRLDPIFSEKHGMELQLIVPIADLDEFLNDNLDPIGIESKRDRRDRDLYELSGTVYEGWLRSLKDPEYIVMFPRKEAIPKGMGHPAKLHEELVKKGYLLFAKLDNSKSKLETRKSAFEKMQTTSLDGIEKRPDETEKAYELRKAVLKQQLSVLQQWFVESQETVLGGKLDREKNVALTELFFSAIEKTQLQEDILRVRDEPSYFTPVETVEKSLLATRVNFMFSDDVVASLKEIYQLSETVAKEQVEEDKSVSEGEKKSRIRSAGLLKEVLQQSAELGVLDAFLDIIPSGDAHTFLVGVRCQGQEQILKSIDELPASREGWKVEKDVAEVEGVKIHKLDLGAKAPKALAELYGESHGVIYLAASDKAFWMAFGATAKDELSKRIKAVRTAKDVKSSSVVFSMEAQVGPLVKSMNNLFKDESSVIGEMVNRRQASRAERKKVKGEEKTDEAEGDRPARQAAGAFLTFDWVDKVVGTMEGENDTVSLMMKVNEKGEIIGTGKLHQGILKAVGVLLANFADENLQ
ncbi:hypothetical protein [Thalassoglobus sp.]|uniref:hypothetical protein n=1 Tax=Thalassoglobus sp. TaxID=2795869 RepID=UPI003AA85A45